MNEHPMSCEEFLKKIDALLTDTLEPGQANALYAHQDSCRTCREAFETPRSMLSTFSHLLVYSPRPYVIENLERSLEAERPSVSEGTLWSRLRAHPVYRLAGTLTLGILAAFVSTFSFSQVALTLEGLTQTLLVCALFWTCGYTGMFDLAFRKKIALQAGNSFNLARAGKRIAVPVLLALGVATLALLATVPFGGLRLFFSPFDGFSGSLAPPVSYSGWFMFGALIGSASLLFGVNLGKTNGGSQILSNGALAASLFVLMIAPGLAIICVPFTLGLFFTLSAGLIIGALSGGILGFWSVNFLRMRLWKT